MEQIEFTMDIRTEKLYIIQKLLAVDDELLIQTIKNILEVGLRNQDISNKQKDFWDDLPEEDKEKITQAIQQLEGEEGIPHKEVMANFRKKYQP